MNVSRMVNGPIWSGWLTAGVSDLFLEGVVEVVLGDEAADVEVHAVAPVVARVGRNVDDFVLGILAA